MFNVSKCRMPVFIGIVIVVDDGDYEMCKDIYSDKFFHIFSFLELGIYDKDVKYVKIGVDDSILKILYKSMDKETVSCIESADGAYIYLIYDVNVSTKSPILNELLTTYNSRKPGNRELAYVCSSSFRYGEYD